MTQSASMAVEALFNFDRLNFGSKVSLGEVYRAIMKIEGVDWVDILTLNFGGPSSAINLVPAFDEILRIRPAAVGIDYGLAVTASGGIAPVS